MMMKKKYLAIVASNHFKMVLQYLQDSDTRNKIPHEYTIYIIVTLCTCQNNLLFICSRLATCLRVWYSKIRVSHIDLRSRAFPPPPPQDTFKTFNNDIPGSVWWHFQKKVWKGRHVKSRIGILNLSCTPWIF